MWVTPKPRIGWGTTRQNQTRKTRCFCKLSCLHKWKLFLLQILLEIFIFVDICLLIRLCTNYILAHISYFNNMVLAICLTNHTYTYFHILCRLQLLSQLQNIIWENQYWNICTRDMVQITFQNSLLSPPPLLPPKIIYLSCLYKRTALIMKIYVSRCQFAFFRNVFLWMGCQVYVHHARPTKFTQILFRRIVTSVPDSWSLYI